MLPPSLREVTFASLAPAENSTKDVARYGLTTRGARASYFPVRIHGSGSTGFVPIFSAQVRGGRDVPINLSGLLSEESRALRAREEGRFRAASPSSSIPTSPSPVSDAADPKGKEQASSSPDPTPISCYDFFDCLSRPRSDSLFWYGRE
ncbi:hypothetical protein MRB53_036286 [Persea americana]|nr:hypothetical protein MRB53_036464 [Persea americana]KAJ8614873.1 hypothetical protein MRB53_036286 [Persea americana]